jgi:uncharacterized protein with PIN domain
MEEYMKEPKCPYCNKQNPELGYLLRYPAGVVEHQDDHQMYKVETDLLYCKDCGAILGYFERHANKDLLI